MRANQVQMGEHKQTKSQAYNLLCKLARKKNMTNIGWWNHVTACQLKATPSHLPGVIYFVLQCFTMCQNMLSLYQSVDKIWQKDIQFKKGPDKVQFYIANIFHLFVVTNSFWLTCYLTNVKKGINIFPLMAKHLWI